MVDRATPHSIINVHALAQQMGTDPEETRIVAERFFASLVGIEGDLTDAPVAASSGSQVQPGQVKSILHHIATDLRQPLPDAVESLGERMTDLAAEARARLSVLASRITTGVASIDVAGARQNGTGKFAKFRDKTAEIAATEIGLQVMGYGEKALDRARDLAAKMLPEAKRADAPKLPGE